MNPNLVRAAIRYAIELCDENGNRVVVTINGTGGMADSIDIRPYMGVGFCFDPDLGAIIIKKKEGRTYIDAESIKTIHCYKQKI